MAKMPRRAPDTSSGPPTLGYQVLDWMAEFLIVPDGPLAGEPLILTREQAQFVLNFYALDQKWRGPAIRGASLSNGRLTRRAVLSRPKGWGKSPLMAALCLAEALADVVLDGWDADGQPVGRSWASLGFKPKVQIVAVSEDQTANTWDPLLDMARNGSVAEEYRLEALETFVNTPDGRIEFATSAATSREGFRPVFAAMDQTESWKVSNSGVRLAATIRRNLAKVQGSSIETPNAYTPGEGSVAEMSHKAWQQQQQGRLKGQPGGILFDHREAPAATDMSERESMLTGLAFAYGDSADVHGGWVTLERILQDAWDPDTAPQDARAFYLNQLTHAEDSWLSQPEVNGRVDLEKVITDSDVVTLGFDGSRSRRRGITDATALIGTRVSDGHQFEIGVWEQPDGPAGQDWRVPEIEVDAAVRMCFDRWTVVGFFADPAKWESYIAKWEADFGAQVQVKASRDHPIEWWMTGGRSALIVRMLEQYHSAFIDGELTFDGAFTFTRHLLNARRRTSRSGMQIAKEHPDSPNKIDAAVAGALSWKARLAAIAAGATEPTKTRSRKLRRF